MSNFTRFSCMKVGIEHLMMTVCLAPSTAEVFLKMLWHVGCLFFKAERNVSFFNLCAWHQQKEQQWGMILLVLSQTNTSFLNTAVSTGVVLSRAIHPQHSYKWEENTEKSSTVNPNFGESEVGPTSEVSVQYLLKHLGQLFRLFLNYFTTQRLCALPLSLLRINKVHLPMRDLASQAACWQGENHWNCCHLQCESAARPMAPEASLTHLPMTHALLRLIDMQWAGTRSLPVRGLAGASALSLSLGTGSSSGMQLLYLPLHPLPCLPPLKAAEGLLLLLRATTIFDTFFIKLGSS